MEEIQMKNNQRNTKYMSKINAQASFKIGKSLWLGGFIGCFKCDDYNKFWVDLFYMDKDHL